MIPWTCEVCGEHNHNRADDPRCAYCKKIRGTWICARCGRKNRVRDVACRACGGEHDPLPIGP